MAEWKQIQQANESVQTTDIKGKAYTEVNQRIKAFRMVHPDGAIITEILSIENGVCIIKATVQTATGEILGTGTAYEKENSSFINKTSYIENCETSAVGRALGMCGFGIDVSIASFEEVANAIENQNKPPATSSRDKLIYILKQRGIDVNQYAIEKGLTKDTPDDRYTELLLELAKEDTK